MPRDRFGKEELAYLQNVVEGKHTGRWGKIDFIPRFEQTFGEHLGRKYVHSVNSGTSANATAYASLGLDVGDEIICPAIAQFSCLFPSLPM